MAILKLRVRADLDNQRYNNPSTRAGTIHEAFRLRTPFPIFYETGVDAEDRQRKIYLAFRLHDNWKKLKVDAESRDDSVMLAEIKLFEKLQESIEKVTSLELVRENLQKKIDEVALDEVEAQSMTIEEMHERIDLRNILQADLGRLCVNIKAADDEKTAVEGKRNQDLTACWAFNA